MYYHTCPYCGANLDPDEHCDCLSRIRGKSPKWNSMDGVRWMAVALRIISSMQTIL